uniref:Uncharacterized protein n=1 Tax=Rhizophora mucronata TaxID=61149 RepID=A0A2P2N0W2_RHIMU
MTENLYFEALSHFPPLF